LNGGAYGKQYPVFGDLCDSRHHTICKAIGSIRGARSANHADRLLEMKLLRFIIQAIADLLEGVTYKWILSLYRIFEELFAALKAVFTRAKLAHFDKNATNTGCGPIHHTSFHRPDPLIYSQQYLLKLGLAVTWDNPDIILLKDGNIVSEGELLPGTEYDIDATIWNNSYDAPAVGVVAEFSYLSFGAGTTSHALGEQVVNLGVKGGVNHPAHARIKWTTPPAGHYCIQVNLRWADDQNPENNLGQNNVNVVPAHSPAEYSFQLRNNTGRPHRYTFRMDTYALPPLRDCDDSNTSSRNNDKVWKDIQLLHRPENYPLPTGWMVNITPAEVTLASDEEAEIAVTITPRSDFVGTQAVNTTALFENHGYAGGVTVYVIKQ
jgi:hypothetical protein